MKLVVAEKPSVARSIAQVLGATTNKDGYIEGNGYQVTWCVGHLITLYDANDYDESLKKWDSKDLPIIPKPFKTKPYSKTEDQFKIVSRLMNAADEIIEATDAGREGELIFRLTYEQAKCTKPIKRLWISSLETSAIRKGFENLKSGSDYDDLYNAAKARQQADWLLGINLTRWYSCGYKSLLPCGRVQTPTINFIVEREREIQNFKPTPYYILTADLGSYSVMRKELEKSAAEKCIKDCTDQEAKITDVQKKVNKENPKPLYDLTSLQQDANKVFGMSAQETLDTLQKLYEAKLATYPRTDSRYITTDQKGSVETLIKNLFDRQLYPGVTDISGIRVERLVNDKKVSDHHAILPTEQLTLEKYNSLSGFEKNIMTLVLWKLLIAAGPERQYESVKVTAVINGYEFIAEGQKCLIAGYKEFENGLLKVLGRTPKEDNALPDINVGEIRFVKKITSEEKMTTPPGRYTEATLLNAMETCGKRITDVEFREAMKDRGLGTPATRASIIESIIKNGYIQRQKKVLVPTEKAFSFIDVCTPSLKQPELTASWEYKLSLIQKGELNWVLFMGEIETFVKNFVETEVPRGGVSFGSAEVLGKCPNCGKNIKSGKFGPYCEGKCGMQVSKFRGKELTDTQVKSLLDGKRVLVKGIKKSSGDGSYDLYIKSKGSCIKRDFEKDGIMKTYYFLDVDTEFPNKKKG